MLLISGSANEALQSRTVAVVTLSGKAAYGPCNFGLKANNTVEAQLLTACVCKRVVLVAKT